jgi:Zn-dependent M28 family amino/carboxypeptidase
MRLFLILLLGLAVFAAPGAAQSDIPDYTRLIDRATITEHLRVLAIDIGARPAGSPEEAEAASYIAEQLASWGYDVALQEFEIQNDATSRNVIATRPGEGQGIVVGAHLDSVTSGTGAVDNASGVAALLAVAEALADLETVRPLTFIAFGAEEIGLDGSTFYVESLAPEEIEHILVMINLDSIAAGEYLYVYAGTLDGASYFGSDYAPGPTWARDRALVIGEALGYPIATSPEEGWNGFAGAWSDHAPFSEQGIAIAYFERWNWEASTDLNLGQETAGGEISHTERDVFENADPAKIEPVAEIAATLVAELAVSSEDPSPAISDQ